MITSLEQFRAAANHSPAALVVKTIPAGQRTPADIYQRLAGKGEPAFLLESVEGGSRLARYSFIGINLHSTLRVTAGGTHLRSANNLDSFDPRHAIAVLRERLAQWKVADDPSLPPFVGGAVGYLAYEAAAWFEPAMAQASLQGDATLARFMLFDTVIAFDHESATLNLIVLAVPYSGGDVDVDVDAKYAVACQRIAALIRRIESPLAPTPCASRGEGKLDFASNFDQAGFEHAVRRIQEHISAGSCYQAVLSQKLRTTTTASAIAIYLALRRINPSPYLFLLDFGDEQLIGASPEMLVRCRNGILEYRPIAGTCPRGSSAAEDAVLAAALLADEKERAEHVMLVDLGRNDLGRVAETGSVEVRRLMHVERYSHVQHIVTELQARLRPGLDSFDALAACFPAGTVTGAPKIRAMQLIQSLEPSRRGTYAGAVLYADVRGNLDSCIAIRSIRLQHGGAELQCGAGIVFDSKPAAEFQETLNKAGAMIEALRAAAGGQA